MVLLCAGLGQKGRATPGKNWGLSWGASLSYYILWWVSTEDIQDMVEAKLMAAGKYELAKAYIIYRYTRALVRKANSR